MEARGRAIEDAIFLRRRGEIWSGPPADLAFNFLSFVKTSVREKVMELSETWSGTRETTGGMILLSVVKTEAKKLLKQLA